jgi:hypothetical protein
MINFIRQVTWIANLFRIKQNIKFYGFLVFWVAYNEIFIGNLSRITLGTGLFTRGVFLNFFLPQPIIHIATIS